MSKSSRKKHAHPAPAAPTRPPVEAAAPTPQPRLAPSPAPATAPARPAEPSGGRPGWLGVVAVVAVAALLLGLGASSMSEDLPLSSVGTPNLWLVFLTGLTTGGLTCLAVQGGLLATAVAQRVGDDRRGMQALAGRAAPIAGFLGAKIVAYTLMGGLLGLLGGAIGLTPMFQGALQIAAGLFMLGVAGQLLNLHPVFRIFSMQPPKWLQRRIRQESKTGSLLAPLSLGALTVFMPCATTQAMMVAALGTGSFVAGAALMFAFTLGTTPLFFSLGYLATQLGARFRDTFMKAAAVAIALLAALSITAGLALLGVPVPELSLMPRGDTAPAAAAQPAAPQPAAPAAPAAGQAAPASPAQAGVQQAVLRAEPTGYVPNRIVFKVGTPAQLRLQTGARLGCTSSFLIPALGYQKVLWKNEEAVFNIPTDKARTIPFTCSMGMYRGVIEVQS